MNTLVCTNFVSDCEETKRSAIMKNSLSRAQRAISVHHAEIRRALWPPLQARHPSEKDAIMVNMRLEKKRRKRWTDGDDRLCVGRSAEGMTLCTADVDQKQTNCDVAASADTLCVIPLVAEAARRWEREGTFSQPGPCESRWLKCWNCFALWT